VENPAATMPSGLVDGAANILAVDDEADFEPLITRFRRQIRGREFAFRFAHHGEEALANRRASAYGDGQHPHRDEPGALSIS
jgi:hypothetical protein